MERKAYKRYSREFKIEAVRLAAVASPPRDDACLGRSSDAAFSTHCVAIGIKRGGPLRNARAEHITIAVGKTFAGTADRHLISIEGDTPIGWGTLDFTKVIFEATTTSGSALNIPIAILHATRLGLRELRDA